jgi:hypothetical protein
MQCLDAIADSMNIDLEMWGQIQREHLTLAKILDSE